MQQFSHADRLFQIFIRIDGRDPAAGGTELFIPQAVFFQTVLHDVVGHADHRGVADLQVGGRNRHARRAEIFDLSAEVFDVYHHAVPHDVDYLRAQNAGGKQIQNELSLVVDDGVSRVVSALVADDDVVMLGKQVHHPALSFVSPVDTRDCC